MCAVVDVVWSRVFRIPETNPHLQLHTLVTKGWDFEPQRSDSESEVYQVGCVYYVITSLWYTVNRTLNCSGDQIETNEIAEHVAHMEERCIQSFDGEGDFFEDPDVDGG
jgi:hypothetical protein